MEPKACLGKKHKTTYLQAMFEGRKREREGSDQPQM